MKTITIQLSDMDYAAIDFRLRDDLTPEEWAQEAIAGKVAASIEFARKVLVGEGRITELSAEVPAKPVADFKDTLTMMNAKHSDLAKLAEDAPERADAEAALIEATSAHQLAAETLGLETSRAAVRAIIAGGYRTTSERRAAGEDLPYTPAPVTLVLEGTA